jgi:hypothetical protein
MIENYLGLSLIYTQLLKPSGIRYFAVNWVAGYDTDLLHVAGNRQALTPGQATKLRQENKQKYGVRYFHFYFLIIVYRA